MNEVNTIKSEIFCRCCAGSEEALQDMNQTFEYNRKLIIDGYYELLGNQASAANKISANFKICNTCHIRLESAMNFREQCLETIRNNILQDDIELTEYSKN
jgi:hypothetical protein